MPNFQTFTKRLVPLVKKPAVTIQKRGTISMNKAAHAALGEPPAVELLYDPEEKVVGFRGIDPSESHAYPLRTTPGETSFILSGRAFTKYFQIATEVSTRYDAALDGDVLCVDLKHDGQVVTSNRNGHKVEDSLEPSPAVTE